MIESNAYVRSGRPSLRSVSPSSDTQHSHICGSKPSSDSRRTLKRCGGAAAGACHSADLHELALVEAPGAWKVCGE